MDKSTYTDFSRWPYNYLHDRAIEAFITCSKGLEGNYAPGRFGNEVYVMEPYTVGFAFNDRAMVESCFWDMVEGGLLAFDCLPYDIDEKVLQCFGAELTKAEHNKHCGEYIDWAFSPVDKSPDYGWSMKKYLGIYSPNGSPFYAGLVKRCLYSDLVSF